MRSLFSFLKSPEKSKSKSKPTTPETPRKTTPEKSKPNTPKKMFSIPRFSKLFKSEPQEDISTQEEVISTPIFTRDSNINVNDEYQRIKNSFLEEIKLKIQTFWDLNKICKTECENGINDEETKKQLENMYITAASGDFLSMCGRINSNISQCTEALKLQRAIQELFIMYKTDTTHNISQEVLDEEVKFYEMTKTKIMKKPNGGRKTRLPKRNPKKTKTQKRQKGQKYADYKAA
jgi:hypothetical protein